MSQPSVPVEIGLQGGEGHAARPARLTAGDLVAVCLFAFERREMTPRAAVGPLRRRQVVVVRALDLVGVCASGEAQELPAELNPPHGDTRLADVGRGRIRSTYAARKRSPELAVPDDVEVVVDDVLQAFSAGTR